MPNSIGSATRTNTVGSDGASLRSATVAGAAKHKRGTGRGYGPGGLADALEVGPRPADINREVTTTPPAQGLQFGLESGEFRQPSGVAFRKAAHQDLNPPQRLVRLSIRPRGPEGWTPD